MGSILRSDEMVMLQLLLPSDSVYACVRELGELGKVEFKDLNGDVNAFQRKFVNELRRCDEMDRMLRFFATQLEKAGIVPVEPPEYCEAPDPQDMIELETLLGNYERVLMQLKENDLGLKKNLQDVKELKHVLQEAHTFFMEGEQAFAAAYVQEARGGGGGEGGGEGGGAFNTKHKEGDASVHFTFQIGVVPIEKVDVFERVLWRSCKGNVFMKHSPIDELLENPVTDDRVVKSVFILYFQGDVILSRTKKLCDGFHATLYTCPENAQECQQLVLQVVARIEELEGVLQNSRAVKKVELLRIAESLEVWNRKVKKMKAIYFNMNKFNLNILQSVVAECWCPVKDLHLVQAALNRGMERIGSPVTAIMNQIPTLETPPTYYRVNKFTSGFHAIVESYGVASFKELNPTPYSIITFPFLFAVMFGDIGHGIMLLLFASVLIIFEKKLAKTKEGGEFLEILFAGRYLLFLMGLFSIYTGSIYNSFFSRTTNVFGSSWRPYYYGVNRTTYYNACTPTNTSCYPPPGVCNFVSCDSGTRQCTLPTEAQISNQPYPYGLDPTWVVATNSLTFVNGYKMKMSIILGLFQQLFGVVLSIVNHIQFKKYIGIVGETIPRIIFLMSLIGWLAFLMFYKWCSYYADHTKAPNLLLTLIYMFLDFGNSPNTAGSPVYSVFGTGETETAAQQYIQVILVIAAVVCVPWMLLTIPVYYIVKNKRAEKRARISVTNAVPSTLPREGGPEVAIQMTALGDQEKAVGMKAEEAEKGGVKIEQKEAPPTAGGHGEGHSAGELMVLSSIHTIEYCLGTISNTASYLRLWALSLAHEQLSGVLWSYAIAKYNITMFAAPSAGILPIIVMSALWAGWAVLTVGILLCLEGLSAFLHALRLHWIEFQNKFYEGEGRKFKPLSFAAILGGEVD